MAKKFLIGSALVIVTIVCCFYVALHSQRPASKQELDEFETRVNNRIEELQQNQDTIKRKIDSVKLSVDTLKVGQRVIFDEVKKNANKTFWDLF